jgi:hypothetical protein
MFIQAIYPIIEFGYGYPMKWVFRWLDKRGGVKTKKITIQQYVNVHAGPDHLLHFKYSSVMTVTYMTFMFGIALPLLFPIAAIAFFVLYVSEKLLVTYYFKKPPMYDEKMNSAAIGILKYAPLFMMFFGFWTLGNRQIFTNTPEPKENQSDPVPTQHNMSLPVDQALPMFIFGCIFFIVLFFNDLFLNLLIKLRLCKSKEEDEVDE